MPAEGVGRSPSKLISVIMPSFNSGPYIGEALHSVLTELPDEVEVIVQDGGSTDQTAEVVREFTDERVIYRREPDSGQADALNKAIEKARGRWILWLNADDRLAPSAFQAISRFLDGPHDIIYGNYSMVDESGRTVKHYVSYGEITRERLLRHGCYVFSGSMLFRREVFERCGLLDPSLHFVMDYEFFLRIAPYAKAVHSGAVLSHFRMQPASKTSGRPWKFLYEGLAVRWRYGGLSVPLVGLTVVRAAYIATRPVWQSRLWRSVRPSKRL